MQTKTFNLFMVAALAYLIGLFLYTNDRAVAFEMSRPDRTVTASVATQPELKDVKWPTGPSESRKVESLGNPVIVATIRAYNETMTKKAADRLATLIERTAGRHDVDPLLVTALVSQESAFKSDAVSPVGALGLGQLMPYTAADLGVDPHDPAQNLDGAVRYLAQNLDTWAHTADPVALALASYNAGPGAVQEYGGVPPYEETQNYVEIITHRYAQLRADSYAGGHTQSFG